MASSSPLTTTGPGGGQTQATDDSGIVSINGSDDSSGLSSDPAPFDTSTTIADGVQTSPTVSISSSAQVVDAAANNSNSNAAKLNKAALIGIIAGGSAFLVLVFLLALLFLLQRRRKRRRQSPPGEAFSEDEREVPKRPSHSRGPSYEQTQQRRSVGDGPVYQAVSFGPQDTRLLQTPAVYHEKDPSSEATTPNMRNSVTLENEPLTAHEEEAKDTTPLDPFSSGYVPPPSPTPSEYVIVEHTTDQPLPPQTSRDKRESRTSLLDIIVPEEGKEFSTLGSVTSARQSLVGHRRTLSNEASGSSSATATGSLSGTQKRMSNRLQKPRRSIESTSSIFQRSTSPFQLQRSMSPIKFPRDPFEASLEEEPVAPLRPSFDRPSLEHPNRSSASYEMHDMDGSKPVSSRPSMDTIAAGGTSPRKKTHVRSPSSPTRVIPNSPSFLGLRKHGASASALSLQQQQQEAPYMNMNSPTMADASVYDFDIYHEPQPPTAQSPTSNPPPSAASAAAAALLSSSERYGSAGSKKRFSASMSDLPTSSGIGRSRFSASMSTNQVNLHGKESTEETKEPVPTLNLYIPKESLDLPPS